MKKTTLIYVLLLILGCLTSGIHAVTEKHTYQQEQASQPLLLGTIQFPSHIHCVPVPRIYIMGKTIIGEIHESAKKVTFEFQKNKRLNTFYLLITESIKYKMKKSDLLKQQTIDYIKIDPSKPYKCYLLTLRSQEQELNGAKKNVYSWDIQKQALSPYTGRIPDETILVMYPAEYIERIAGGNELELPTISIKPEVISMAGSEQKLQEQSTLLQLASLDVNALHAPPMKHVIKQIGQRTLIAANI